MPLPKLNLRDLFWLVLVVAMGLGWWLDRTSTYWYAKRAERVAAKAGIRAQDLEVKLIEALEQQVELLSELQQRGIDVSFEMDGGMINEPATHVPSPAR